MKLIFANRNYSSWSLRRLAGAPALQHPVRRGPGDAERRGLARGHPQEVALRQGAGAGGRRRGRARDHRHHRVSQRQVPTQGDLAVEPGGARAGAGRGGGDAWWLHCAAQRRADEPEGLAPGQGGPDEVAGDLKRIERLWGDLLSRSGGPYLFGSFTAADAMFAPVAARIRTYAVCRLPMSRPSMSRPSTLCRRSRTGWPRPSRSPGWWSDDEIDVLWRGRQRPAGMIHMIKLCVGVATLEELEGYRSERAHWWGADYGEDVHVHRTRTMPKRAPTSRGRGRSTG
jgi:hypothetical protein